MQQPAPTLVLPRGLILLASAWLVLSWAVAIGFHAPLEASSSSYTPGVRLMLMCVTIGLMIGWPLLRLSQGPSPYPTRQTLLDLVVLLALVQVVVWPLRLVTPWTPTRTAALDATLAAWSLLIAALVTSAIGSRRAGPRNLAALVCVGVCVGGPAVAWLTTVFVPAAEAQAVLLHFGPLLEVHRLTEGGGAPPSPGEWQWIGSVALAGIAAWAGLGILTMARHRREHGPTP